MITLYNMMESGNCYKIRLFLNILGLDYNTIEVDLKKNEQKTAEFLKLNPRGEIPVLVDNETVVWDSQAILVYLAKKYGHHEWLPESAEELAHLMQWLCFAEQEIFSSLMKARSIVKFGRPGDLDQAKSLAEETLKIIDDQLDRQSWIALDRFSIADIACYPYLALAGQANISLKEYAAIQRWMNQIEQLKDFIAIPGLASQPE